jgi:hypothetical protein
MLISTATVAVCLILISGPNQVDSKAVITITKSPKLCNLKDVTMSRPLMKSPGEGGLNGTSFDDLSDFNFALANITGVRNISISSGDQVDSMQVTYVLSNGSLFQAPRRGKVSHPPVNISLTSEESIVRLEGKTNGALVDQITITTIGPEYERKVYGPFGKTGLLSYSFDGHIVGFHGRSGDLLDRIGVYSLQLLKKSETFGGTGGSEFDDKADLNNPPIVRIAQLHIWNGELIDAIQAQYLLLGGEFMLGKKHGEGNSGNLTTINFADGEEIVSMLGQSGDNYVNQLTFITKKKDGSEGRYGPFGTIGKHSFSIYGNILGFFGTSGLLIDTIGVYYT